MAPEININEFEIDLNESEIDLNECEHFLKANLDRPPIAQWLIERLTGDQKVAGSIPVCGFDSRLRLRNRFSEFAKSLRVIKNYIRF